MLEANVPLLAMPSGSILQFLLMTVPLLCVYLYFLYLAYERPSFANIDNPRYGDDRIRLTDILYVYLVTLLPFGLLVVYMLWFVPMRRGLSARYEKDGIIVLGDVTYDESYYDRSKTTTNVDEGGGGRGNAAGAGKRAIRAIQNFLLQFCGWVGNGFALRNNYGHVVYDLERVAAHPACDYEERHRGSGKRQLSGIITKRVRVYHRYPREQVSILVLPEYPYSGQPKIDMEADWASFAKYVGLPSRVGAEDEDESEGDGGNMILPRRDRGRGVLIVAIFWVCFLVLSSYYVVSRIVVVDDAYNDEDAEVAWTAFWIVVGGIFPAVSILGNWIRWKIYERWMLHSGSKMRTNKTSSKDGGSSRRRGGNGDEHEDMGGGSYVQMS